MPRKPRQRPQTFADLFDYLDFSPPPAPETPVPDVSMSVTDDWPEHVPVGRREVELTETHLEKVLAELLGPLP
jgi:hypothetical protein